MANIKDSGGSRENRDHKDQAGYVKEQRDYSKKSENTVSFDKPVPPDKPKKD